MWRINMQLRCEICKSYCKLQCGSCKSVYYCSKEHQKLHWDDHKIYCMSTQKIFIEKIPNPVGNVRRVMVARVNLKKGDKIFSENAVVRGPNKNLKIPQEIMKNGKCSSCIVCYRMLDTKYIPNSRRYSCLHCAKCFWPICGPDCQEYHEQLECEILQDWSPAHFFTTNLPAWKFIFIIRVLMYKEYNPQGFKSLMRLDINPVMQAYQNPKALCKLKQDSAKELIVPKIAVDQRIILRDFMRLVKHKKIEKFMKQEKLIYQIIQIIEWNSIPLHSHSSCVSNGIFQLVPAAVQSCIPNVLLTINSDYRLVCIANKDIKAGEEIKMSKDISHIMQDNYTRKTWLERKMYITCNCPRCSSPSELGTYHSALKCYEFGDEGFCSSTGCKTGNLLPYQSSYIDQNKVKHGIWYWKCDGCERIEEQISRQMRLILHKMEFALKSKVVLSKKVLGKQSLNLSLVQLIGGISIIKFLEEHESVRLHSNHSIILEMKLQLAEWLSQGIHEIFHHNKQERFKRQIQESAFQIQKLIHPFLKVLEILHPGISTYAARLTYLKQQSFAILVPEMMKSSRIDTLQEKSVFERKIREMIEIRKNILIVCSHLHYYQSNFAQKMTKWIQQDGILYKHIKQFLSSSDDKKPIKCISHSRR